MVPRHRLSAITGEGALNHSPGASPMPGRRRPRMISASMPHSGSMKAP
jgi:hypothetical protein